MGIRRLGQVGQATILSDYDASYSQESNITFPEPISVRGTDDGTIRTDNSFHATERRATVIGYFIITAFLVALVLLFFVVAFRYFFRRRNETGDDSPYHPTRRATKQRIQRRYETIEHWIITKRVMPHDDFCSAVVSNFNHHKKKANMVAVPERIDVRQGVADIDVSNDSGKCPSPITSIDPIECPSPSPTIDINLERNDGSNLLAPPRSASRLSTSSNPSEAMTDDECSNYGSTTKELCGITSVSNSIHNSDVRECPICFGELQTSQYVSWSASELCSHVYHHECIKEWLLRHVECCLCKNTYLPVDEKKGRAKTDALRQMSQRFAAASATSYYCVSTGLVRIPKSVRCTRSELQQLEGRIFEGSIPPTKLATLRGSFRQESGNHTAECSIERTEPLDNDGVDQRNLFLSASADSSAMEVTSTILDSNTTNSNPTSFDYSDAHDVEEASSSAVTTIAANPRIKSFTCTSQAPVKPSSSRGNKYNHVAIEFEKNSTTAFQNTHCTKPPIRVISTTAMNELVSVSEFLEQTRIVDAMGDNRCRIIDSCDELDGVEVSATTTSQMLTENEELVNSSATSSVRSDIDSVVSSA